MNRRAAVPAMVNAHSHAFQLDLRGIGERPNPDPPAMTSGAGARPCTRWPASHTPESMRAVGDAGLRADGGRRLRRRRRVSLRPPPARRHPVRRAQRDGDRARARRPWSRGLEIVLLPAAYHRGGPGRAADRGTAAVLRSVGGGVPGARRRSAGVGGRTARACHVGVAAHSVRAVPADWLSAIAALRRRARPGAPRPRLRAAPRAGGDRRRARLLADRAAASHRLPRAAHERRARDPRRRRRHRPAGRLGLDRRHLPDHRGQPRRRPPARDCATATPGCGWRSGPTSRSGSTRSRSCGRWRRWPAARATPATRCWRPPTATCGGATVADGRASLGLRGHADPDRIELDLDHPDLAGVAEQDLPLALATCASAAVVARAWGIRRAAMTVSSARPRRHRPRRLPARRLGGRAGRDRRRRAGGGRPPPRAVPGRSWPAHPERRVYGVNVHAGDGSSRALGPRAARDYARGMQSAVSFGEPLPRARGARDRAGAAEQPDRGPFGGDGGPGAGGRGAAGRPPAARRAAVRQRRLGGDRGARLAVRRHGRRARAAAQGVDVADQRLAGRGVAGRRRDAGRRAADRRAPRACSAWRRPRSGCRRRSTTARLDELWGDPFQARALQTIRGAAGGRGPRGGRRASPAAGQLPDPAAGARQRPPRASADTRAAAEVALPAVSDNPVFLFDGEPVDVVSTGGFHSGTAAPAIDAVTFAVADLAQLAAHQLQRLQTQPRRAAAV